jgi:hypothetical protein
MLSATSLEWQKGTKIEATKQTKPKQEKKIALKIPLRNF